jgi:hypothetical protein
LEAATAMTAGLTAEAEQLEVPWEELSCQLWLQPLHLGEEVVGSFVVGGLSLQPIFVFVIEDVLVRQVLEDLQPTFIVKVVTLLTDAGPVANKLSKTM